MEPTTPKSSKGGRPKNYKSFRGRTPKQEIVAKCNIDTKNVNAKKTNLDDEVKAKIKTDDKNRKSTVRENLDDEVKVKIKADDKNRKSTVRENDKKERITFLTVFKIIVW